MPESLYITRCEFNQLMKKITYLEEYVKNSYHAESLVDLGIQLASKEEKPLL